MSTHHAAAKLAHRRKHYQALVNEGFSADDIACAGAALGEEELAAEALRKIDPALFTERGESDQMDKPGLSSQQAGAGALPPRALEPRHCGGLLAPVHARRIPKRREK